MADAYIELALFVEVLLDEERADGVAQVAVDVRDAKLSPRRRLFAAVQPPVELLLGLDEPGVQVVDPVTDEPPQDVVGDRPVRRKGCFNLMT